MGIPHEIYSLLPPGFPWHEWVAVICLFLGVLALFAFIYYRRPSSSSQQLEEKVDLVALAYREILKLHPPKNFPIGKVQEEYFYALGIALRQLIEQRWSIKAAGSTLAELTPLMHRVPLPRETVSDMLAFMELADQIKFASRPSSLEEAERKHQQVVLWAKKIASVDTLRESAYHQVKA